MHKSVQSNSRVTGACRVGRQHYRQNTYPQMYCCYFFVRRRDENMSPFTGNRVNTAYEANASRAKRQNWGPENPRGTCNHPLNTLPSVSPTCPWPSLKMDWHSVLGIKHRSQQGAILDGDDFPLVKCINWWWWTYHFNQINNTLLKQRANAPIQQNDSSTGAAQVSLRLALLSNTL